MPPTCRRSPWPLGRECPRALCAWGAALVCAWLLAVGPAGAAAGEDDAGRAAADWGMSAKLSRRGDLTLRDLSLTEALFQISEIWNVSVVVGEAVEGKVNGVFDDAPLAEILDAILLSNGYGYRPVGNSLVVMKLSELGDWNPMFVSAVITCASVAPQELLETVRMLSSPGGKAQVVAATRSLVVFDFPDRVAAIRKFVADLDEAAARQGAAGLVREGGTLAVEYFRLQYAKVEEIQQAIAAVLSEDGKAAAVPQENRLVVIDYPARVELARRVVKQMDQPRAQVRITALIYDISLSDMERLGVNWGHALKFRHDGDGTAQTTLGLDNVSEVQHPAGTLNGMLTLANLSRHIDINAIVQALQDCKDSRLLANPNVTVLEHQQATIKIITEIPFQQLTQTQQGGNIGTTSFRDAGIELNVTPQLADDDTLQLLVKPSFSRLIGFAPGDVPLPILDKREAETLVRVANGQLLVIGGLRARRDQGDFQKIPGLGNLRGIGWLFRSRDTTVEESELVVFLRPELLRIDEGLTHREADASRVVEGLLDQIPPPQCPPTHMGPVPSPGDAVYGEEVPSYDWQSAEPIEEIPAAAPHQLPSPQGASRGEHRSTTPSPAAAQTSGQSAAAGAPGQGGLAHRAGTSRLAQPRSLEPSRGPLPGPLDYQPPGAGPRGEATVASRANRQPSHPRASAKASSPPGGPPAEPAARGPVPARPATPFSNPARVQTPAESPTLWARMFGSDQHPAGWFYDRRPHRSEYGQRFQEGRVAAASPQAVAAGGAGGDSPGESAADPALAAADPRRGSQPGAAETGASQPGSSWRLKWPSWRRRNDAPPAEAVADRPPAVGAPAPRWR